MVADADVGERAADHDAVVTATGTEAVEVPNLHAPILQEPAGRAVGGDRPGRTDVVGRDAVAQQGQHAGPADRGDRLHRSIRDDVQERRVLDVGAVVVPTEQCPAGHVDIVPQFVVADGAPVFPGERLGRHRTGDRVGDLRLRRPNVPQVNLAAVVVGADRFVGQIDVGRAGQRVGDDQRRRSEVVRLGQRIDAALKVPVPRQHRRGDQIAVADRLGDRRGQGAGVADAVVDGDAAGDERMHRIDRQVVNGSASGRSSVDQSEAEGRQVVGVFVRDVAPNLIPTDAEPAPGPDLVHQCRCRRKTRGPAVERPEGSAVGGR